VALMSRRGDLRPVRIAWFATAVAVALGGIVFEVASGTVAPAGLLALRGPRIAATLTNPNVLADYLVFSVFVGLGLEGQLRRLWLVPSFGVLLLALIMTKSNGGLVSLMAGTLAWLAIRIGQSRLPRPLLAGAAALVVATVLGGGWAFAEWGVGTGALHGITEHSFLSRAGHSSESRQAIWRHLEQEYARSPLGIGPDNSAYQMLAIGERERPDSFLSKEAHNDFLAYAIERGPLGLIGLLMLVGAAAARAWGARRGIRARLGARAGAAALWGALIATLLGSTVHSTVIEKMHFRHFWLFLAMLYALAGPDPQPTSAGPAGGLRPSSSHPPLASAA
jgi:O-antigen ligase